MNRKQRRQRDRDQRRVDGGLVIAPLSVIDELELHCPDCASEVRRFVDADGFHRAEVAHDDTCPTWQAMQ